MLRNYKHYDLPVGRVQFSSYPGLPYSGDDFYINSNSLVVMASFSFFFSSFIFTPHLFRKQLMVFSIILFIMQLPPQPSPTGKFFHSLPLRKSLTFFQKKVARSSGNKISFYFVFFLFCSVLSILFCSILSILFFSILFCSILFFSILSFLFCSILSILFCSILSILFCSIYLIFQFIFFFSFVFFFFFLPTRSLFLKATYLATTSPEWHQYFERYNNGGYNNQWIILDYKG